MAGMSAKIARVIHLQTHFSLKCQRWPIGAGSAIVNQYPPTSAAQKIKVHVVSMGLTRAVPIIFLTKIVRCVSVMKAGIIKKCFLGTGASIFFIMDELVGPLLTNLKTTN